MSTSSRARKPRLSAAKVPRRSAQLLLTLSFQENVPPARFEQAQKASNVSDMVLAPSPGSQLRAAVGAHGKADQGGSGPGADRATGGTFLTQPRCLSSGSQQIDFLEHSGKEAKQRLTKALGEKAHAQKQLEEATATVETQVRAQLSSAASQWIDYPLRFNLPTRGAKHLNSYSDILSAAVALGARACISQRS